MYSAVAHKHYFNQTPLYELNYGKLMRFFRSAKTNPVVAGTRDMRVVAMVIEDHKYTSIVDFEVSMESGTFPLRMTMTVRLCHDAQVAEVISCSGLPLPEPEYTIPNKYMHHRDEKQQINRLLGEWLDFFTPSSAPVTAASPSAA